MNRFERHPILTLGFVLAVLLGLMLAVSEALLQPDVGAEVVVGGDSVPSPQRFLALREWQPLTRFSFGPTEERIANAGSELQGVYPLDTDQFGFVEPSVVHKDADVEIVFVGGSTTESLYVQPENRFPYRTGRLLEERLGLTVNSINAGKSGNNAMHSLLVTIGKILPRRPDFVILMNNTNDVGTLYGHGTYWNEDASYALVRARERSFEGIARDLRDMTIPYTYRHLRRAMRQLSAVKFLPRPDSAFAGQGEEAQDAESRPMPPERMRREFESALRSFVAVVRAWHSEPVLMTQVILPYSPGQQPPPKRANPPSREQLLRGDFAKQDFGSVQEFFNAVIRHVALSENVALVDLARARDWSYAHLYDTMHFIDSGSRHVAAFIAEEMEPLIRRKLAAQAQAN